MWASSVAVEKLPKVNNHSLGGNSPNLVTLFSTGSLEMTKAPPFVCSFFSQVGTHNNNEY
jgi:hypothetical protein